MSDIESATEGSSSHEGSPVANGRNASKQQKNQKVIEDEEEQEEEDDDMGLFGDDDEEEVAQDDQQQDNVDVEEEAQEAVREEDLKTLDISLVRHSKTYEKATDQAIKLQVPTYIGIDCKPFDPTKFTESVEEPADKSQQLDDKVIAENTIRWRYSTNREGEVYRQSNSQIIEWDDGSYSLRLGGEVFDIRLAPNEDNFLVMTHDDQDVLQTQEILTQVAKIVPTSTASLAHKRLTKAISHRQASVKQHKMKSIILDEDPELRIKALEKAEEEAFKARRRAELKRLHEEEKFERGSPAPTRNYYSAAVDEEDEEDMPGADARKNEYDDDDGFIDDNDDDEFDEEEDEDELDRAAERLKKVKEAGRVKYQAKSDGNVAEDDEAEEEEEETVTRKKRRIISDDEDEE